MALVLVLSACASTSSPAPAQVPTANTPASPAAPAGANPAASPADTAAAAYKTIDLGHFSVDGSPQSGNITIYQDPTVTSCLLLGHDLPHGQWAISFIVTLKNDDTRGYNVTAPNMSLYDATGKTGNAVGMYVDANRDGSTDCNVYTTYSYFQPGQGGAFTGAIPVTKEQMTAGTLTLTSGLNYDVVASIPMSSLGIHVPSGN